MADQRLAQALASAPKPDAVGESEYRSVYEVLETAESVEHARGILDQFEESITVLRDHIPATRTMKCADEEGWPEREFVPIPGSRGVYACPECDFQQSSFADGVQGLVLSAEWNSINGLIEYLKVVAAAGVELQGDITVDVIR